MEESLTYLKEQFELPDVDIRSYSPLVLAYIGDGIYELVVRTAVVGKGNRQANALHKKTPSTNIFLCRTSCRKKGSPLFSRTATLVLVLWTISRILKKSERLMHIV